MAGLFYNRGKTRWAEYFSERTTTSRDFKVGLVKDTYTPNADDNLWGDAGVSSNEIATGNGYSAGGAAVTSDSTGFPTNTEDDTNDRNDLVLKDVTWTPSGGPIPSSGAGARWIVLYEDGATKHLICVWDAEDVLGSGGRINSTVGITLSGFKMRLS